MLVNRDKPNLKRRRMKRDKFREFSAGCWPTLTVSNPLQFSITTSKRKLRWRSWWKSKGLCGQRPETESLKEKKMMNNKVTKMMTILMMMMEAKMLESNPNVFTILIFYNSFIFIVVFNIYSYLCKNKYQNIVKWNNFILNFLLFVMERFLNSIV